MEWASENKVGRRRKGEMEKGNRMNCKKRRKREWSDVGEEKGRREKEKYGRRISWGTEVEERGPQR